MTIETFISVLPTVLELAIQAVKNYSLLDKTFNNDRTRERLTFFVSSRTSHSDNTLSENELVDRFLAEVRNIDQPLSKTKLSDLLKGYEATKYWPSNRSTESATMWNLAKADDLNDNRRAQQVLEYMCNRTNWVHGSCEYLWNRYAENKLFDPVTPDNTDNVTPDPSLEGETPRP